MHMNQTNLVPLLYYMGWGCCHFHCVLLDMHPMKYLSVYDIYIHMYYMQFKI